MQNATFTMFTVTRAGLALAAAFALTALSATDALAQPAPITYAGARAGPAPTRAFASLTDRGVDRQTNNAPVIDLTRTQARAPQNDTTTASNNDASRPAWLERERVGQPYEVGGRWYAPTAEPGYERIGTASWYGPTFHGRATATGEIYDQEAMTAAHPTLPIPSLVQVTNLENGREVIVRVNDRGPFVEDRVIDMSHGAAQALGFAERGTARVHIRYLGPAPRRYTGGSVTNASAPAPATTAAPTPISTPAPRQTALIDSEPLPLLPPPGQAPVEARTLPAVGSGSYVVQIGAFSDLTNAHRIRDALSSVGPVQVDTVQRGSGELFRVRVGGYASRAEADAARSTIAAQGYSQAVVAQR